MQRHQLVDGRRRRRSKNRFKRTCLTSVPNGTGYDKICNSKSLLTKCIIIREVIPYIVGKVEKSLFEKQRIQDIDIFIWALLTNQNVLKQSFKASWMQIRKFKTANRVVSHMITS